MERRDAVIAGPPRLHRYAIGFNGDRSRADDLLQDMVERALSRLHLWKAGANMRDWLFTNMHNRHVNNPRRDHARGETVALDEGHPAMSLSTDQTGVAQMAEPSRAFLSGMTGSMAFETDLNVCAHFEMDRANDTWER